MDPESGNTFVSKAQRVVLGCLVLLLVDVIWVSSSELTKYIYHHENFEKPFFCTYVKTSMFTLYLLGFCFWPPWRDFYTKSHNYVFIDPDQEDENFYSEANTSLSNPVYVPVKTPDRDPLSSTESDDSSVRSVRFNKLAEVRHMSELEATEALLARLSYQASLRADEIAKRAAIKLSVERVAKIAFIFCFLWFLANYTFQVALSNAEAGTVTVLSSTSSFFTLILAALFPSGTCDKFTLSKFIAVIFSIGGVVLVSLSGITKDSHVSLGVMLSLLSAFFYSAYIVFLRRKVDHEDKMDIPLFFGFVGLFNLLLLWPLFFVFHYTQWEKFEWPSKHQLIILLVNGLIGTVVSEVLWLWGCFLTSSLMATLSITLTVPLSMLADVFLRKVVYPCGFYIGSLPIVVSCLAVAYLTHAENRDPALDALRCAYVHAFRRNRFRFRFAEPASEQTEALIGINSGDAGGSGISLGNEHEA